MMSSDVNISQNVGYKGITIGSLGDPLELTKQFTKELTLGQKIARVFAEFILQVKSYCSTDGKKVWEAYQMATGKGLVSPSPGFLTQPHPALVELRQKYFDLIENDPVKLKNLNLYGHLAEWEESQSLKRALDTYKVEKSPDTVFNGMQKSVVQTQALKDAFEGVTAQLRALGESPWKALRSSLDLEPLRQAAAACAQQYELILSQP